MPHATKSTSIRSRIYWASGFLVAACVLGNVAGWFGQRILLANIDRSEKAEQVAARILDVDRDTLELKSRAETFVQTGAETAHSAALRIQSQLTQKLSELAVANQDAELASVLPLMQHHLKAFGEQLALAADERNVRTRLVHVELPEQDDRVDEAIAGLRIALDNDGGGYPSISEKKTNLLKAVGDFATARKHILAYFIQPRSDQYQGMLNSLADSHRQFAAVTKLESAPEIKQAAEDVLTELDRYRALGTRAVQATRGYMFYVNVVMAGEISEFRHYSNELKRVVADRQVENQAERQSAVARFKLFSLAASIGAILLAIAMAFQLAKLILQPVTLLTDTFLSLSRGETVDQIPASDRTDEIGRMAQAAAVFSRKNMETKTLLDRSQKLSEELADKATKLEESNLELDNFAYVASHDLKSPLRGLRSLAEWIGEDCEELLPDSSKKHLLQMQARVDKMDGLLSDLLDYSRIGKNAGSAERVDVHQLVQSIVEIIDKPNGIQIEADSNLPQLITFKTPLQQILMNLITNAIKYNDKAPNGRVTVTSRERGEFYEFLVCDNGIGIDPIFHDRIFQMYQRVAPEKIDGTGMGLAIVKRQVECRGGSIEVESIPGEGSIFSFTWPKAGLNSDQDIDHSTMANSNT